MPKGYLKEYELKDFANYTAHAESVEFLDCIRGGYSLNKSELILPDNVEKVFYVDGKVYSFCTDKFLYLSTLKGCSKVLLSQFNNVSFVTEFKYANESRILVKDGEWAYFIGDTLDVVKCPNNTSVLCDNGRIYFYGKNTIYFNDIACDLKGVYQTLALRKIIINKSYGEILTAFVREKSVCLVTERALLKLTPSLEYSDFSVDKICDLIDTPNKFSLSNIADKIIFFSNKRINIWDEKLKSISSHFTKNMTVVGQSFVKDNIYVLPVIIKDYNYLYLYDLETESQSLVKLDGFYLTAGGVIVKKLSNQGYELSLTTDGEKCRWQSTSLSFESDETKVLCGVKILSSSPVTATVRGGDKSVTFISGERVKRFSLGIRARSFNVEITGKTLPVNVQKIIFYFNE